MLDLITTTILHSADPLDHTKDNTQLAVPSKVHRLEESGVMQTKNLVLISSEWMLETLLIYRRLGKNKSSLGTLSLPLAGNMAGARWSLNVKVTIHTKVALQTKWPGCKG